MLVGNTSFRKTPIRCPKHGKTHMVIFLMPEPGEYRPAEYVCLFCYQESLDNRLIDDAKAR